MNLEKIIKILSLPESETHDFKQEWYKNGEKSELVKDIFSFVNTTHDKDCYIIFGVNDSLEVIGIEEDKNRKNQQMMINFVSSLPIANDATPKVYVKTFEIESHEIDVLVIPNTFHVPIYLSEKYPVKNGQGRFISPGQIYSRIGDTNTPINSITNFYQVEELWKKYFRLNVSVQERFEFLLEDTQNWSYISAEENRGFVYNFDPDFFISIEDDDMERYEVEAYSINQIKVKMTWTYLKLKFRTLIINSFLMNGIDGQRYHIVSPDLGFIRSEFGTENQSYYQMEKDSLAYKIENMINKSPTSFSGYGGHQNELLEEVVVYYENFDERNLVEQLVSRKFPNIKEITNPSTKEISGYSEKTRLQGSSESVYNEDNICHILQQMNLAKLINREKESLLNEINL